MAFVLLRQGSAVQLWLAWNLQPSSCLNFLAAGLYYRCEPSHPGQIVTFSRLTDAWVLWPRRNVTSAYLLCLGLDLDFPFPLTFLVFENIYFSSVSSFAILWKDQGC